MDIKRSHIYTLAVFSIVGLIVVMCVCLLQEKEGGEVDAELIVEESDEYECDVIFGKKCRVVAVGTVSKYDSLFVKYAKEIGWDWKLLAALSWSESRFNSCAVSSQGAKGLMQLMPVTARKYGLTDSTMCDAELNIRAGVRYLKYLDRMFRRVDEENRWKFMVASYNSGPGHVIDAMALAEKYKHNRYQWEGSVEKFLLLKADEKYYRGEVCRHGRFRGNHTVRHVRDVKDRWGEYGGIDN